MPVPPSSLYLVWYHDLIGAYFVDFAYTLGSEREDYKEGQGGGEERERGSYFEACAVSNGCRKWTHLFALGKINIIFLNAILGVA